MEAVAGVPRRGRRRAGDAGRPRRVGLVQPVPLPRRPGLAAGAARDAGGRREQGQGRHAARPADVHAPGAGAVPRHPRRGAERGEVPALVEDDDCRARTLAGVVAGTMRNPTTRVPFVIERRLRRRARADVRRAAGQQLGHEPDRPAVLRAAGARAGLLPRRGAARRTSTCRPASRSATARRPRRAGRLRAAAARRREEGAVQRPGRQRTRTRCSSCSASAMRW